MTKPMNERPNPEIIKAAVVLPFVTCFVALVIRIKPTVPHNTEALRMTLSANVWPWKFGIIGAPIAYEPPSTKAFTIPFLKKTNKSMYSYFIARYWNTFDRAFNIVVTIDIRLTLNNKLLVRLSIFFFIAISFFLS